MTSKGFMSALKKFGQEALKVITLGAVAAETAAPFVAAANPAIGTLLGGSAQIILAAETAGAAAVANAPAASTGAQKAALAVTGITPLAEKFCENLGLSKPSTDQVNQFSNYLVAALNVFGVVEQTAPQPPAQ